MNNWFNVKCKFTKESTDGTLKRVTEPYLVNAMSFTEAEAAIYREVGEFVRGEFLVTAMAKVDYMDIFAYTDSETWYEAKVSYVSEDADSGEEKKITNKYLVTAHTVKEAYERIEESLKGLMVTYETPTITKTPIVEIFPYDPEAAEAYAAKQTVDAATEEVETPNVNVAYAAGTEEGE